MYEESVSLVMDRRLNRAMRDEREFGSSPAATRNYQVEDESQEEFAHV